MKINFHKQPAIDFVLRLTLTIIIISPVIYFSWDAVKGTSGNDYVESVVFIVAVGFFWFVSYLFFSSLAALYGKRRRKNEDGAQV